MKAMIRLALCVVMAASSTAVLAEGADPATGGDDRQPVEERGTFTGTSATSIGDKGDAEVGAASGEPARSDMRAMSDARARGEAAKQQYDEQLRQQDVWTTQ